ncbi:MAG: DUF3488 domain-containing protein [Caldilineaceae bacterium]|nr:DUF3488 domain-containing protein [Caldilineaceae bacterium]
MASTTGAKPTYQFRYADSVYFYDGNLFNSIIVALLYLIVATSLDAAGYVSSLALLVRVTLGALSLSLLMSYSRFDGFFALSHSLFTGLAWILFLMTGLVSAVEIEPLAANGVTELQAKAYFVLLRWLNWLDAAINNTPNEDNYIFVFEISFLVWWLTYLGVWAIFRYGYTWRAVTPAAVVLLINTYYAPKSILGFLVVFSLLALVLLIRTNLSEQQLRWREQRIYFSQDIALDFLRSGFMFSVMVLALAWLVPGLGRNLQVRQVLAPVNERLQQTTERFNRLYQGLNRQARPAASTFGRSLTLGGARNVTDRAVFQVQTNRGRYWRAVVYDTYTGRQWLNTADEEQEYNADQSLPVANWALREPLSQTITLLASTGNIVLGAPDMLQASVPIAARSARSHMRRPPRLCLKTRSVPRAHWRSRWPAPACHWKPAIPTRCLAVKPLWTRDRWRVPGLPTRQKSWINSSSYRKICHPKWSNWPRM